MINKNLESLESHNAGVLSRGVQPFDKSILLNGIACPECGCELYDGCSIVPITMSNHRREVFCMSCNYRGSRLV